MPNTTTELGRLKLAHPDLGYQGGSTLHELASTLYTKLSDNIDSRYAEYSSVANSAVTTVEHNLGVALTAANVLLYTGTGTSKTAIANPTASGWTIAATTGFTTTKVDITAPSTGGPHTFSVALSTNPNGTVRNGAALTSNAVIVGSGNNDVSTSAVSVSGNQMTNALGSVSAPSYSFTGDTNTGIYSAGADQVNIATAGTMAASISSTGQFSLGQASPAGAYDHLVTNGTAAGGFTSFKTSTVLNEGTASTARFFNGPSTNKMEIGVTRQPGLQAAGYASFAPSSGTSVHLWANSTGSLNYSTSIGNVGSNLGSTIASTSDERLKTNKETCPYGLAEVMQLEPLRYTLYEKTELGFGAQTTQEIIPEAVYNTYDLLDPNDPESPPDKLNMSYFMITPVAVKAIQDLNNIVSTLRSEFDTLKAEFDQYKLDHP